MTLEFDDTNVAKNVLPLEGEWEKKEKQLAPILAVSL